MPRYSVMVPIAGHIIVDVDAENEDDAKNKALLSDDLTLKNIHGWEALEQFNQGNVCFCPSPWEIDVEELETEEG